MQFIENHICELYWSYFYCLFTYYISDSNIGDNTDPKVEGRWIDSLRIVTS